MKKKNWFFKLACAAAAIAIVLSGCNNPTGGSGGDDGGGGGNGGNNVSAAGYINGTVTITNSSGKNSDLRISASYYNGTTQVGSVDGNYGGYTIKDNGSFSIPFVQNFLNDIKAGQKTLQFTISKNDGSGFRIVLDGQKTASAGGLTNGNLNVGSLGTVSLASTSLSGTITVNDGGKRIPFVQIVALVDGKSISLASLTSPVDNASWTMIIPVQHGNPVTFYVSGSNSPSGEGSIFNRSLVPSETSSVFSSPISGITLNIGNINDTTGGGSGSTFTISGAPAGAAVFAVTSNPSNLTDVSSAILSPAGSGSIVSGNTVTWVTTPSAGTYTIILFDGSSTYRKASGVSIGSNGTGSVSYSSFTTITGTGDGGITYVGKVTFSEGLPSGTWAIYVVPNETITDYSSASKALANFVALGASTNVSGSAANLITTGATGGTFNPNGTYAVLYMNSTNMSELIYKYKNGVSFSSGNATLSVSGMTSISLGY
jgi:hypothetical protein